MPNQHGEHIVSDFIHTDSFRRCLSEFLSGDLDETKRVQVATQAIHHHSGNKLNHAIEVFLRPVGTAIIAYPISTEQGEIRTADPSQGTFMFLRLDSAILFPPVSLPLLGELPVLATMTQCAGDDKPFIQYYEYVELKPQQGSFRNGGANGFTNEVLLSIIMERLLKNLKERETSRTHDLQKAYESLELAMLWLSKEQ